MTGLLGRTFGGYELTDPLKGDGIAEVYRARPRASGREAVVKLIPPEFAQQPGFITRFDAIVAAANRLSHPHILPLVGSGEQNGYLYLISPFVEGGTLGNWLANGRYLGAHDVAPFFRQVCEAASYAHSQGVIHGNIKPANMFLHEGRHLLLGDFGRLWDVGQIDMTHAGSGVEAVEYLAPEALTGTPDQLSDIYSLGAVLYASLCGHPPFRGATPQAIFNQHARASIPRLADASPPLAPEVIALDEVIATAMAKAPDARYPSALKLAQAIESRVRAVSSNRLASNPPKGPVTPAQPVSLPGGLGLPHPLMPPPSQPSITSNGLGGGLGRPPLGASPPRAGFEPLPPALAVEPEMEAGRAEHLGRTVGNLGDLAKLPATALPGQPGAPSLGAMTIPPVDLPTGRVPTPGFVGTLPASAPVSFPPAGPAPAPHRGEPGLAAGFDPAALPTIEVPSATPFSSGPGWMPFVASPAGGPAGFPPPAPNGGVAPSLAMPGAPGNGSGFPQAPRMIPAPGGWPPMVAQPAGGQPSSLGSAGHLGSLASGAPPARQSDDWFGIEMDDHVPASAAPAAAVGIVVPGDQHFSPTRLGLPRLSTPELGGVAPSWRDTISEPSSPSMTFGTGSVEQDTLAGSGQWTGESERWSESHQWAERSDYWSENQEAVNARDEGRQRANWRDRSRPGASTEHARWADSRADSQSYSASSSAYAAPSVEYSVYDPETEDDYWDDSRASRSVRTRRARHDDERDRDATGRGRAPHPYDEDAYEDDPYGNSASFGASSAYVPMPTASRGSRSRRTAASQALERAPSRRVAPLLVLALLLLLVGGLAIVGLRPDLCPGNRCMAAHATLMRELGKLGIGNHPTTGPALSASPTHAALQVAAGASAGVSVTLTTTSGAQVPWSATSSLAWLTVSPPSGAVSAGGNAHITLTASPSAAIAAQTYNTTVQITSGGTTLSIPVTITVAASK